MQDNNLNEIKLEVHDIYKKLKKLRTKFEPTDDVDVVHKSCLDEKLLKLNVHLSFLEIDYNGFNLLSNEESIEEVLSQRAVKTTIQILCKKSNLIVFPLQIWFYKVYCFLQSADLI